MQKDLNESKLDVDADLDSDAFLLALLTVIGHGSVLLFKAEF